MQNGWQCRCTFSQHQKLFVSTILSLSKNQGSKWLQQSVTHSSQEYSLSLIIIVVSLISLPNNDCGQLTLSLIMIVVSLLSLSLILTVVSLLSLSLILTVVSLLSLPNNDCGLLNSQSVTQHTARLGQDFYFKISKLFQNLQTVFPDCYCSLIMKKEMTDEKCKWRLHNFVKDDNSCCRQQMRHQSEPDLGAVSSYINLVFSFYDSSSGLPFFFFPNLPSADYLLTIIMKFKNF